MKRSILITGVSGAGKTALSGKLKELGYSAYDLDDVPGLCSMIDKETGLPVRDHDNADLEKVRKMDWICGKEKLIEIIESEPKEVAFYCGASSNMGEIVPLFDRIILLKVYPDIMRQRLLARTNNDFGRTKEVQDWILSYKDWFEEEMLDKGAIVVNSNKPLEEVAADILLAARI